MSAAQPVGPDPNLDPDPLRAKVEVRVSDELKAKAQSKAAARGTTVSAKLREALELWTAGWEPS